MNKHNRGLNSYYKPQIIEFHTLYRFLKSTDTRNERIESVLSGQNWSVHFSRLNRTGKRTGNKELGLQALIRTSSPLSLSTKKILGRSSRGFTRHLHLVLCSVHLHYHECEPEEGSQTEEDEMRMPRPHHHSQSRSS
jgi:hypothetical protein